MKLFYYMDTGHRIGLDRLRRSAPVAKSLEEHDIDVTVLTNDFRAGEYAKSHFGVCRYVSVDLLRNIANIATPADTVVLDTDDISRSFLEDMIGYFGKVVRISNDPEAKPLAGELLVSSVCEGNGIITADIVDPRYFVKERQNSLGDIYFWGDDDYECRLLEFADIFANLDIRLLEGYYFFMQYTDELENIFISFLENESYDETLKGARRFITSSPQSALEALAAKSDPIYIKKGSSADFWSEKMSHFGIPVIDVLEKKSIEEKLFEDADYRYGLLKRQKCVEVAQSIVDFLEL